MDINDLKSKFPKGMRTEMVRGATPRFNLTIEELDRMAVRLKDLVLSSRQWVWLERIGGEEMRVLEIPEEDVHVMRLTRDFFGCKVAVSLRLAAAKDRVLYWTVDLLEAETMDQDEILKAYGPDLETGTFLRSST